MVDIGDLKSPGLTAVWVRVPLWAQKTKHILILVCVLFFFETWARIELAYSSFAENRLTTWPPGRNMFV